MINQGHISVHELKARMDRGEDWQVLDVRTIYEYRHSHIDGSLNIDVGDLMGNVDSLPRDKPIAVICASGSRSNLGCRLLMSSGLSNVFNVLGGMSAWVLSGYPVS